MSKPILAVDCDLTVVRSDEAWLKWLTSKSKNGCNYSGFNLNDYRNIAYNLGEYFPDVEGPLKFWRKLDYATLSPIDGSVDKLKELSEFYKIIFVSAIKGKHAKSKYYWLDEHFPFNEGVILTKEKYLLNDSVAAMIDDRQEMLCKFDFHKRIQFDSPYEQTVQCAVKKTIKSWQEINVKEFVEEFNNGK